MIRNILGVIAGYAAMFIFVMLTFSLAYLAMGAGSAFQEGTYDISITWIIISILLGLIAAVIGGFICVSISRNRGAVIALAIVTIVLGVLSAIPTLSSEPTEMARSGDVSNFEAMSKAQTAPWLAFLNPVIGAAGIMIGAGFRRQPRTADPA